MTNTANPSAKRAWAAGSKLISGLLDVVEPDELQFVADNRDARSQVADLIRRLSWQPELTLMMALSTPSQTKLSRAQCIRLLREMGGLDGLSNIIADGPQWAAIAGLRGLVDGQPKSRKEVARELEMEATPVFILERTAFLKLQNHDRSKGLLPFD